MPFLDVEQLKKATGQRCREVFTAGLPALQVAESTLAFVEPAQFNLTLTNIGNSVINVDGTIEFLLQAPCSRCLSDFQLPLSSVFNVTYYEKNLTLPDGLDEEWIAYTGDVIDITPEVLNAVLMDLPMRFICREQCKGLCPVCGMDLNIQQCGCVQDDFDPRLAKLKELLES